MLYDPTKLALFHPELQPPLLPHGPAWRHPHAICAELSRLAYIRFDSDPAAADTLRAALAAFGYAPPAFFIDQETDTQAFATGDANDAFIVFRGTQSGNLLDFLTDAKAVLRRWPHGEGAVHLGFLQAFQSVAGGLLEWRAGCTAQRVWITGHSLGAALATLLAARLPADSLVTFGAPRVGDADFAGGFDVNVLAGHVARYVDCCDVVTTQPLNLMGYAHLGGERYIDRHGMLSEPLGKRDTLRDQVLARLDFLPFLDDLVHNVGSRELADHAPVNYLRALLGPAARTTPV